VHANVGKINAQPWFEEGACSWVELLAGAEAFDKTIGNRRSYRIGASLRFALCRFVRLTLWTRRRARFAGRTSPLKAWFRHAHDLISDTIGFLLVRIARLADRKLRP
jgi:hypothetical protein